MTTTAEVTAAQDQQDRAPSGQDAPDEPKAYDFDQKAKVRPTRVKRFNEGLVESPFGGVGDAGEGHDDTTRKAAVSLYAGSEGGDYAAFGIDSASSRADILRAEKAITASKGRTPVNAARELFAEGRRFRVVKEGARFEALCHFGQPGTKTHRLAGWSRRLQVGEIVTCTGWKLGHGQTLDQQEVAHSQDRFAPRPAYVADFTGAGVPENAGWVAIWPLAGLWKPWPLLGYLEALPYDEEA